MAEQGEEFEVDGVAWVWFGETPGFRCEWGNWECEENAEVHVMHASLDKHSIPDHGVNAHSFCPAHAKEWSGGQVDPAKARGEPEVHGSGTVYSATARFFGKWEY